jgi:succinate dehydrogenase hydrophobic anchor subunit
MRLGIMEFLTNQNIDFVAQLLKVTGIALVVLGMWLVCHSLHSNNCKINPPVVTL